MLCNFLRCLGKQFQSWAPHIFKTVHFDICTRGLKVEIVCRSSAMFMKYTVYYRVCDNIFEKSNFWLRLIYYLELLLREFGVHTEEKCLAKPSATSFWSHISSTDMGSFLSEPIFEFQVFQNYSYLYSYCSLH